MKLFRTIGISYRRAAASVRDVVAFTPDSGEAFLDRLAEGGVRQAAVLSTCNRCEVFYWGDDAAAETCRAAFAAEFASVSLTDLLEVREGDDALAYLCRVAAGLDSMVFGEYQILGQLKDAAAAARAAGHVGKELDRILRDAVTCAKRIRTELDIGAVPPSVCRAGMELVATRTGFSGRRVLVIGSGKTGTLAVSFARRHGAREIFVCNRSPERAKKLEAAFDVRIVDYASRYEVLADCDIVVSATASPHVVVRADHVTLVRPVVFLDLASPRDIDPALAENPMATLLGIDTIGELAKGDRDERERLTAKGMEIVLAAVAELSFWLDEVVAGKDVHR